MLALFLTHNAIYSSGHHCQFRFTIYGELNKHGYWFPARTHSGHIYTFRVL